MTAAGFGLVVQQLPRRRDRVLAVGHLVGTRAGDNWFSPGDIASMFEALRLPRPGNISQELARLRDAELVMRRGSGGSWSLTPLGRQTAGDLVGDVDAAVVEAELAPNDTAPLAGADHPLIPPELAPVRFLPAIRRLLDASRFEQNVFCMTRFPRASDAGDDPLSETLDTLRGTLRRNGLVMHLASDRTADDELFGNIAAHMWGCKYGIALLETRGSRTTGEINDNVLIEIGAMLMTGRRCGLFKDVLAPKPPSDFVAHIYRELDFSQQEDVRDTATKWIVDDLGLGRGAG